MLVGCAPSNKSVVEVGEPQPMNPQPAEGGARPAEASAPSIDFQPQEIKGITFNPSALDHAELPGNGAMVKRSLADQKKRADKAKGAARQTEGKDYALLLWYSQPAGEPKDVKKLLKAQREEALKVLAPLAAEAGASEDVLAAYAAAEQAVGDEAKAAVAWDAVITKFPKSARLARYQALRNYLALKARQPLPFPLPESVDGAPYEAAYVTAWSKFRAADRAGAVAAITAAAKGWTNHETLPRLRPEVMLIYSRAGGGAAEAHAILSELVKKDNGDLAKLTDSLADAYAYAGEYEASAGLREKQAEGATPQQLGEIRLAQALVNYRLLRPAQAADAALAAWTAVAAAGDAAPPELREAVAKQIVNLGMLFHTEYAKTHDARFAEPARKLYTAYVAIPGRADADKIKKELLPNLESTITTYRDAKAPATVGALDQPTVQRHVTSYIEQVGACYEAELQGDPTLAFAGKLSFEIDKDGKVTAAKLDGVAEGDKGAPAVARCLAARAATWLFPASGTSAKVNYPLSFKSAK